MPDGDVAVVREQFDATNERDFARAMTYYADDVDLVVHPHTFLNEGTFRGREAVGEWFGDWFRTFEPGYRFDIEEARDVGGAVLLVASHHGRGRTSGAEVHGRTAYLYRLQGDKIVRVEIYPTPAEALEGAGLEPEI